MELPDEHLPVILRALEHYADYMEATSRDDTLYRQAVELLKWKAPAKEQRERRVIRKRG